MSQEICCPLCDWKYVVPELDPRITDSGALASVFGLGIFAQHAINSQMQKTEEALQKHLSLHKLEEWVRAITAAQCVLEAQAQALEATWAWINHDLTEAGSSWKFAEAQRLTAEAERAREGK